MLTRCKNWTLLAVINRPFGSTAIVLCSVMQYDRPS